MAQALLQVDGRSTMTRRVGAVARAYGDAAENAKPQQIAARLLNLAGAVPLAALQQQSIPNEAFLDALETSDSNFTDVNRCTASRRNRHIQRKLGRVLVGGRRVDRGKGV